MTHAINSESALKWDQETVERWLDMEFPHEGRIEDFLSSGGAAELRRHLAEIGGAISAKVEGHVEAAQRPKIWRCKANQDH